MCAGYLGYHVSVNRYPTIQECFFIREVSMLLHPSMMCDMRIGLESGTSPSPLLVEGLGNVWVNVEPLTQTVARIESHNAVSVASALKIDIFPIVFSLANFSPLNAYRCCLELRHAMLNLILR